MAVTWTKATITQTNPFDGTQETFIKVNDVRVDGVRVHNVYSFPDGTSDAIIQAKVETDLAAKGYNATPTTPTLADLKNLKKYQFKLRVTAYIGKHYDQGQQASLQALWAEGIANSWANRKSKVQSVLDWIKSVLSHFYTKLDAVDTAADSTALAAVDLDLAQFDATDPLVSVRDVKDTVD